MPQTLVSVPPSLDAWLRSEATVRPPNFARLGAYVGSDPVGARLGSGGGTISLLYRAWREADTRMPFETWVAASKRLVLHAGGESRRLPAYASIGKALIPVPSSAVESPTRYDQTLADFQVPLYEHVLCESGSVPKVMVASGDVWLDFDPLTIPAVGADISGCGMRVSPEIAQHFGVFFVPKPTGSARQSTHEQSIAFFRQKPTPAEIYRHAADHDFYVDTGLWLFSARAASFLLRLCGWDEKRQRFDTADGQPAYLDLYTDIGAVLGERTQIPPSFSRAGWHHFRTSVIPLEQARFFHVGSSRQLLESYEQLSGSTWQRTRTFSFASDVSKVSHPSTLPVWIDNSGDAHWTLEGWNIASGSAPGQRPLRLKQEQCVDIAPTLNDRYIVRPYCLDDRTRGSAGKLGLICGRPAAEWLSRRGFVVPRDDVFDIEIYPIVTADEITQSLLDWFFAAAPENTITAKLRKHRFVAASAIPTHLNYHRYFADRRRHQADAMIGHLGGSNGHAERMVRQDFSALAQLSRDEPTLRRWLTSEAFHRLGHRLSPEHEARVLMLEAELAPRKARPVYEERAHARLRQGVIAGEPQPKSDPRLALKEDQIVWGRSPVRLDLAGGWTDTPPYCLEHGGTVINAAVLLNGQPPIQVFVRPLAETIISLKSIDLGVSEVVQSYRQLAAFQDPRAGFSLPKAALCMAGLHPDFAAGRAVPSLAGRLKRFGGGLEISLLSAVPKGSGLGTSSILAATILGALNRACNLGWDELSLYSRVLGVEQLLTTGGGWQDQAGALFRGLKLIETRPGRDQTPSVRYLPTHLFEAPHANRSLLLYYTGITRLAKGILKEIVDDMLLGRFETLQTLSLVRANAQSLYTAIQQSDSGAINRCIARSWSLNKRLDPGTTTPAIERILEACGTDLAAAKLLGAGGGGYVLLCASDADAGQRIRARLEANPPNDRARFIDFEIAQKGLEVTVS